MVGRMARSHWLDHLIARKTGRARLFRDGFGDVAEIEALIAPPRWELPRRELDIVWERTVVQKGLELAEGTYASPVPELPEAARKGHLLRMLPPHFTKATPIYVVPAASGDQGFSLRKLLYGPLVRDHGIGVVLVENPLYGARRPPDQTGAFIRTVRDHFAMTVGVVEEIRGILGWFEAHGFHDLGVSGFSMGASIAAIVATCEERALATALFAAAASPVPVFLEGLLSRSVDFAALGGEDPRARLAELLSPADLLLHAVPKSAATTVIVAGKHDGYVSPDQSRRLHEHWQGSELVWVETGHPGLVLRHGEVLRAAARRAFRR